MAGRKWTKQDVRTLKEAFRRGARYGAVARQLGRSYPAVQTKASKLGLSTRSYWTDAENATLRRLYVKQTAASIARRLGRTARAVYQQAEALGLSKLERTKTGRAFQAAVRRLNRQGYGDTEIADTLGCERRTATRWRQRLGLPSHAKGQRYREKVRAITRQQCAAAGVANLAEIRSVVLGVRSALAGWPAGLRPRAVQILDALAARGPMTRPQIAEAVGMPWKGSRASLRSNDPEGSYLANLIARGLVVDLGRLVKEGGQGRNRHLYSLAIDAEKGATHGR
jgi:hypothetical protein